MRSDLKGAHNDLMTWQTVSLEMKREVFLSRALLDHLVREEHLILSQNHERRMWIKQETDRVRYTLNALHDLRMDHLQKLSSGEKIHPLLEEVAVIEITSLYEQLEVLEKKIHVQIQQNEALLSLRRIAPASCVPKTLRVTTWE
ncbi:MAG: hypothetical protein QRY72_04675 [Candidatus Rhabdochlamydia sp.]